MRLQIRAKNTVFLTRVALSAALMAVFSVICIPFFIPLTLQVGALYFILFAFGGAVGFSAVLLYVSMGLVGLPVFSGFGGGVGRLLEPSGGFILGFVFASLVYFLFERCLKCKSSKLAGTAFSFLALYACGAATLLLLYSDASGANIAALTAYYIAPYIIPDIAKAALAYFVAKRIKKHFNTF